MRKPSDLIVARHSVAPCRGRVVMTVSRFMLLVLALGSGWIGAEETPRPGDRLARRGDEIVICGQLFHTTAPVVLWTDPGGYDAYRVERRFGPWNKADWKSIAGELDTPNRYGLREGPVTEKILEQVRGGGWDIETLRKVVDQFVVHYDVCGTSARCFQVLHDARCLSVHFMLDIDGTIYQTLDLKERAWHATTSNSRSVGIEIAHIGAYPEGQRQILEEWYPKDATGLRRIQLPARMGNGGVRTPDFIGRPARQKPIVGKLQNVELMQYDFTPEQYDSLIKLTATLCRVFPLIKCDYPRDHAGQLIPHTLPPERSHTFQGVLAHYHIQDNKTDPGPAFDWERVIGGAQKLLEESTGE